MKTSSAKAKGRRCVQRAKDLFLKHYSSHLRDDDLLITSSGTTGRDLNLSPRAQEIIYPFAIEAKNTEKINMWDALSQAREHMKEEIPDEVPLVIFTRNREDLYCALKLEDLIFLMKQK